MWASSNIKKNQRDVKNVLILQEKEKGKGVKLASQIQNK